MKFSIGMARVLKRLTAMEDNQRLIIEMLEAQAKPKRKSRAKAKSKAAMMDGGSLPANAEQAEVQ